MNSSQEYEISVQVYAATNRHDIMGMELTVNGDMGMKPIDEPIIALPVSVHRVFKELARLQELLVRFFPDVIVPAIPEKSLSQSLMQDVDYLKKMERRIGVFLNRLARHPSMVHNNMFIQFLSQDVFNPTIPESPKIGAEKSRGFFKSLANVSKSKKQVEIIPTVRCSKDILDEEGFKEKYYFISTFEAKLGDVVNCVVEVDRNRRALSTKLYNLGHEFSTMGKKQELKKLEGRLSLCSQGCLKSYSLLQEHAESNQETLQDVVSEYFNTIPHVKHVINYRTNSLIEYNDAVVAATRKSEEHKNYGRSLKYDPTKTAKAKKELDELVVVEEEKLRMYEGVVERVEEEWKRFNDIRVGDFKRMLKEHSMEQRRYANQQCEMWQSILADVRQVAVVD
eukprot:Nk52_evm8s2039 gene=Nk52_evmTU8s2039